MKQSWKAEEKRMLVFTGAICLSLFGAGALYEWNNRVPDLKIPQATMPQPNAFDFYSQATQIYRTPINLVPPVDSPIDTTGTKLPTLYSPEYFRHYPLARKQQFLKANQKVLQLMRQGAEYSYLQPPEREGVEVSKYQKCRDLTDLLLVQSHAHAQAGNWHFAADSLLDVLRFSYQIQNGAALRGGLTGNAIRAMGEKDLRLVLPRLSAKKAKLIAKQIEIWEANRVLPAQILEEEKRAVQAILLQLIRVRDLRPIYTGFSCLPGMCGAEPNHFDEAMNGLNPLLKMRLAWMDKPHLVSEYSRCMDWYIAQSKLPHAQRAKTSPFPDSDDFLEAYIYPQYQLNNKKYARQEINTALTLTMLALHAYKLEHKKYPQKLSALVPEYLKRVPLDPCSDGKELRYRLAPLKYIVSLKPPKTTLSLPPPSPLSNAPAPSSTAPQYVYGTVPFTLYSVGFNARDDGGIPYEDKTANDDKRYAVNFRLPENAKVDIVAGIN